MALFKKGAQGSSMSSLEVSPRRRRRRAAARRRQEQHWAQRRPDGELTRSPQDGSGVSPVMAEKGEDEEPGKKEEPPSPKKGL